MQTSTDGQPITGGPQVSKLGMELTTQHRILLYHNRTTDFFCKDKSHALTFNAQCFKSHISAVAGALLNLTGHSIFASLLKVKDKRSSILITM
jgi:hypothetical protein